MKVKFQILKSSLWAEGKHEDPVSQNEDRPHSAFSGRTTNFMEFSCYDALASCTSNCTQIGVTLFFTPVILLYIKRVILLYNKRPHGTSICSGEEAMSRSINLVSLIFGCWRNVTLNTMHWKIIWREIISSRSRSSSPRASKCYLFLCAPAPLDKVEYFLWWERYVFMFYVFEAEPLDKA